MQVEGFYCREYFQGDSDEAYFFGDTTFSIMTLTRKTFSIITRCIMTFRILTFIMMHSV
jgi:hypothetical protein